MSGKPLTRAPETSRVCPLVSKDRHTSRSRSPLTESIKTSTNPFVLLAFISCLQVKPFSLSLEVLLLIRSFCSFPQLSGSKKRSVQRSRKKNKSQMPKICVCADKVKVPSIDIVIKVHPMPISPMGKTHAPCSPVCCASLLGFWRGRLKGSEDPHQRAHTSEGLPLWTFKLLVVSYTISFRSSLCNLSDELWSFYQLWIKIYCLRVWQGCESGSLHNKPLSHFSAPCQATLLHQHAAKESRSVARNRAGEAWPQSQRSIEIHRNFQMAGTSLEPHALAVEKALGRLGTKDAKLGCVTHLESMDPFTVQTQTNPLPWRNLGSEIIWYPVEKIQLPAGLLACLGLQCKGDTVNMPNTPWDPKHQKESHRTALEWHLFCLKRLHCLPGRSGCNHLYGSRSTWGRRWDAKIEQDNQISKSLRQGSILGVWAWMSYIYISNLSSDTCTCSSGWNWCPLLPLRSGGHPTLVSTQPVSSRSMGAVYTLKSLHACFDCEIPSHDSNVHLVL